MTLSRPQPPQDLAACHAVIERLWTEIEELRSKLQHQIETGQQQAQTVEEQQQTIANLTADLQLLKRALFGSRRERFIDDPQQTYLFEPIDSESGSPSPLEQPAEPPTGEKRRTSKGRGRRIFPESLPRKPIYHELSDADIPEDLRNDPRAKRFFKKVSEQLEITPTSMFVIANYQEVIVREDDEGQTTIVSAKRPPQLIDAYVGPAFLAHLTASRFADHLPYYRQEDILSRYGFRIGRSTLWRWIFGLAAGVEPLVQLMRRLALQSLVLGVDETPVRMLAGGKPGGSATSYLWDIIGDEEHPYDCFYFTASRSRDGPDKFLSGYEGYLQSDAYICYELISEANEGIRKVGCWAHARRKFEEINHTAPSVRTHTALAYFQRLYDIEDRGRELSEPQRLELRQAEARPIVAEFHQWLVAQYERELPKSRLRAAIGYMTNRWEAFARYLECGAIPIDNNRTEAALKFAVLGRKAWLFFGNPQGGHTAAALFTLTKSCNRHHVDPYAYLLDVYTRLPTVSTESELEALLPDQWIKEHPQHRIEERVDEARQRAERTRRRRAQRRRASA